VGRTVGNAAESAVENMGCNKHKPHLP
jgi:hypothetical protein